MVSNSGDADRVAARMNRRKYVQAIVASTVAGLAGCGGNAGTDDGNQTGNGNNSTTSGDGAATQGPPVSDTITLTAANTPGASNINPWANALDWLGDQWMHELTGPTNVVTKETYLSGREFDTPWMDDYETVSVPAMVTDYEVNPPYDVTESLDDRLTYWDGTPLDAEARVLNDTLWYFHDGGKYDDTMTINHEAVDQWTFHWWHNKGEVEAQQADPANQFILDSEAVPVDPPFHPGFTEGWVEQFRDASTQDAVNSVRTELQGTKVGFETMAEEQWGSGLYHVESPNDMSADSMTYQLREDHPNEHAEIPNLEIRFATASRSNVLISEGEIDYGGGIIQEEGELTRQGLPDKIQQVDSYLSNGGDQLVMNWNNDHLSRLWVRRAIIAAVDWNFATSSGWGPAGSIPNRRHVGLIDTLAESTFDSEFLDSLYEYPMGSDIELAEEWMQRAGYTKENGVWTDWEGSEVDLYLMSNADISQYISACQVIQSNLQELGFKVGLQNLDGQNYNTRAAPENLNYDLAMMWAHGTENPWNAYWANPLWASNALIAGHPTTFNQIQQNTDAETDYMGHPLTAQVPSEIGSIEAPDQAGRAPDLPNGEEIDIIDAVYTLRQPDVTEESFQEAVRKCARYANFYLPDFVFHQFAVGMWGNMEEFTFPPQGHEANRTWKDFGGTKFGTAAGMTRLKYTEEFESP